MREIKDLNIWEVTIRMKTHRFNKKVCLFIRKVKIYNLKTTRYMQNNLIPKSYNRKTSITNSSLQRNKIQIPVNIPVKRNLRTL
jgi:hypothetical protein